MKHSISRLCLFAATVLAACNSERPTHGGSAGSGATGAELVRGRILVEDSPLAAPVALAVAGPYIVVADAQSDSAVMVVDRRVGRRVGAFGRTGDGPGEFRALRSFQVATVSGDSISLWFYDVALRRLSRVSIWTGDSGRLNHLIEQMLRLETGSMLTGLAWTRPDQLIAVGLLDSARLAVFDSAGGLRDEVGQLPPNPEAIPVPVLLHAYQATLALRPSGDRIVLADRHAGELEIFDTAGTLERRVAGPVPFGPVYTVRPGQDGPVFASNEDLRFGYTSVAASDARVYALFSGRTRRAYPGEANYGEYVHVFDWNGRFLRSLRLDAPVFAIAVDPADSALYAVAHDPGPMVISYPLPQATEAAGPASAR